MYKHLIVFCLIFSMANSMDELMEKTLDSLGKTVNYIKLHQNEVLADCIFGVFLARIFVKDVFGKSGGKHLQILRDMDEIVENSRKLALDDYSLAVFSLIPDDLFDGKIVFNKTVFDFPLSKSRKIDKYVQKNTMKCFGEIQNCDLSAECLSHFVYFKDLSFGYYATHKLLYLQFARAHKCLPNNPKKIKEICSKIFPELQNGNFDLMLEEISLCAFEGFWQFLDPKILQTILSTQHENGCFKDSPKTRFPRSTKTLDDGCIDHTTGLGASTLAAFYSFYHQ